MKWGNCDDTRMTSHPTAPEPNPNLHVRIYFRSLKKNLRKRGKRHFLRTALPLALISIETLNAVDTHVERCMGLFYKPYTVKTLKNTATKMNFPFVMHACLLCLTWL